MKYIVKQASLKRSKQITSNASTHYSNMKQGYDCMKEIVSIRYKSGHKLMINETEYIKLMTGARGTSKWKDIDFI